MPVETLLGPLPLEHELIANNETASETTPQPGSQVQTPSADQSIIQSQTPPTTDSVLAKALETINQLNDKLATSDQRLRDTQSDIDRRVNVAVKQALQRQTPQNEDEWNQVLTNPDKLKGFILSVNQQAGIAPSPLTQADADKVKMFNVVTDFQNDPKFPNAKQPAFDAVMTQIISEQIDNPSQITRRMLEGAYRTTEKLFAASGAQAQVNATSGNQSKAGSNGTSPAVQNAPIDSGSQAGLPSPVNIQGSGITGESRPRVTTMDDLKRMSRKVDWTPFK